LRKTIPFSFNISKWPTASEIPRKISKGGTQEIDPWRLQRMSFLHGIRRGEHVPFALCDGRKFLNQAFHIMDLFPMVRKEEGDVQLLHFF